MYVCGGFNTACYCAFLYCTLQILHFFINWKSVATSGLASSRCIGGTFVIAFAHLGSLCHISNFSQSFSILLYLLCDLWSVVFDVTIVIVLDTRDHDHTRQWTSSINVLCSDCFPNWLSPCDGPSVSLRHSNIEMGPMKNPKMASKCSSERKSFTSSTLNQKLKRIKLGEEGMLKAEIVQKLGLLCQLAQLWMQRKSSWRKFKVLF